MPYVLDKNDAPLVDNNGNKIEFSISYIDTNDWYKHREGIHINDDGHLDTEDRHLVIKDAILPNHAVSKNQLDQLNNNIYSEQDIDNKLSTLQNSITTSINNLKSQITIELKTHEAKILTQMLNFRNEQVKNRIQRKYLKIPKTVNTVLKLFDNTDVGGVVDLKNVIILNVFIRRFDRYHHSKSALLERDFNNTIEFFYNSDMTGYYTYFTTVPSNWDMSCFIEWLRIPQPISIDSESIPSKSESNE